MVWPQKIPVLFLSRLCEPQELQRLSHQLRELLLVSRRAIEAASSALNIPVHADSRADLAVDQLVDNLILQLQVLPVPLFSAGVGRNCFKAIAGQDVVPS